MKLSKNKHPYNIKHYFVKAIAIVLIFAGLIFSAVNAVKYARGYFSYRTAFQNEGVIDQADDSTKTADVDNLNLISETKSELYTVRPEIGEEVGELYIPKLKATIPIYEGTNEDELEKGVGHFSDSVLPGEKDNSILSGHRDTVFRELGKVGKGDVLIVRTSAGEFKYKINKVRIVEKDDLTVIVPKPTATLTVSTCYPFDYIGAAPKRYILVAHLASKTLY